MVVLRQLGKRKCIISHDEHRNQCHDERTRPTNSNEAKQTANATIETANRTQWNNFKDKVTKVQDRLRDCVICYSGNSYRNSMSREVNKITQNQTDIINEINTAPYSIIAVLPSQVQFVDDLLQMVTRLIMGIVISYGAINQMEKIRTQNFIGLRIGRSQNIKQKLYAYALKIRDIKAKVLRNKRAFQYYVNRDKQVVESIMKNIKSFKMNTLKK